MKNITVLILLCTIVSSSLLVSCGSSQAPTAFISTDASTLLFLNWKPGSNNTLSGQWYRVMYETPYSQSTQVQASTAPITGTLSNNNITIQSSGITLYTGTQKDNDLELNGANGLGQTQTTHWYATDQATYNQLVKVFEAQMSTRIRLAILTATLNLLPVDSDPATGSAQVQGIKNNISILQSQWSDVQAASPQTKCSALQYFLLTYDTNGIFVVPDASKSTLAMQIAQVQTQWTLAQAVKQPTLPQGMTLPWMLTPQQVTNDLKPAQTALVSLQKANTHAQTQVNTLKPQYTTLATQVNALKKTCSIK